MGRKYPTIFPPPTATGLAQVTIPPLTDVSNGVIIPYIVCLNVPGDEQICASESFLVWNTR